MPLVDTAQALSAARHSLSGRSAQGHLLTEKARHALLVCRLRAGTRKD